MVKGACLLLAASVCVVVWSPFINEVAGKQVCFEVPDVKKPKSTPDDKPGTKTPPETPAPGLGKKHKECKKGCDDSSDEQRKKCKQECDDKFKKSEKTEEKPELPTLPKRPGTPREVKPKIPSFPDRPRRPMPRPKLPSEPKGKRERPEVPTEPEGPPMNPEEVQRAAELLRLRKWPDNTVPFVYHPKFKKERIAAVKKAIEKMEKVTCIRFEDKTGVIAPDDSKQHKVVIQGLYAGCFATVGYNKYLKTPQLNLERGCFSPSVKTIMHELSHTLGMFHTQSRYDRDNFIRINEEKIQQGMEPQFKISGDMYGRLSMFGLPYDYNSIMHYPTNAFAKDPSQNTMTPLKDFPVDIGNGDRLTRVDVASINRMYHCENHYLGDDIQGGIPYKAWYKSFLRD